MSDTPEACPFCGAEKVQSGDSKYRELYACGVSAWKIGPEAFSSQTKDCINRELAILRPKAVAYDRLEEMVKDYDQTVVETWVSGTAIVLRGFSKKELAVQAKSTDLVSAISSAHSQWKEQK